MPLMPPLSPESIERLAALAALAAPRRYTAAEARELAAKATPGPWGVTDRIHEALVSVVAVRSRADDDVLVVNLGDGGLGYEQHKRNAYLLAAAPDLAATVCALEAERDALRAAVREYLAAHFDERHADATAFTAFWNTNNMLAPDYPQKCAAHSAARARWKDADEKRITALAALREAAK